MVWGRVTSAGKTQLVTIPGNLTAHRYIDELLQPHVVPFIHNQGLILMHDNAPAHRARITSQFLHANNVSILRPWTALSPDLTPSNIYET